MEVGRRRRRSVSRSPLSRYGYVPYVHGTDIPLWDFLNPPDDEDEAINRSSAASSNKRARVANGGSTLRRQLPKVAPGTAHDDCAICLHSLAGCTPCRAMPCCHTFHERCIFRWIRKKRACPLCRHPLPRPEQLPTPELEEYDYHDDDRLQLTMPVPRQMLEVEVL